MVPDEFLPSMKLVAIWRSGLSESTRISRGRIAANAVADIPDQALLEEISCTIYTNIIAEFRYARMNTSKVLPLFDEGGLWSAIAKRIDHCLPLCDKEAGHFMKILESELRTFFMMGRTWKESWGKVCVDDGIINVHLTPNASTFSVRSRKQSLEIDL